MGLLQSYSLLLLKYPNRILASGISIVLSLFVVTLYVHPIPSFKDPFVGLEVRGTNLAARINTWTLLREESSASASLLSLHPNSTRYDVASESQVTNPVQPVNRVEYNVGTSGNGSTLIDNLEPPIVEMSTQQVARPNHTTKFDFVMDDGEEEYYRSINTTAGHATMLMHYSLDSSKAFCGKLYEGYAQVVVVPPDHLSSYGLFNLNSMLATCQIDHRLRLDHQNEDSVIFKNDCEQYHSGDQDVHRTTCCNSWSLPNYVACLNNKTTCMNITWQDLKATEQLLTFCAPHYYKAPYEECFSSSYRDKQQASSTVSPTLSILASSAAGEATRFSYCGSIPDKCLSCNGWTFTVLHYLVSDNFVKRRSSSTDRDKFRANQQARFRSNKNQRLIGRESNLNRLAFTNIFLPMAKSSSLMKYYHALSKYSLGTPFAQVKVMNLGLRNSLFEHLISDDMKLFLVALVSILIVISIYTWSFILSLVILMIICLSLCLSYTIYSLVLNIPIFPFMNLLAIVISFGICSDNAMLFCKYWSLQKPEDGQQVKVRSNSQQQQNSTTANSGTTFKEQASLDRILKRATMSTSVATLATACSFVISTISSVTAVRCFCIFATLSVLTNYLFIVLLLPPALILDSRLHDLIDQILKASSAEVSQSIEHAQRLRVRFLEFGETFHKGWIFLLVTRFKFYLITTFITLLMCSSILVFYSPTLQPAEDDQVQLLSRKHAFEQYDKHLRNQFAFERAKQSASSSETLANNPNSLQQQQEAPETLPVRVVFGVLPRDNGNHFDPHDRGSIEFDQNFNFTDPDTQIWLLEFCRKLKKQRFIHPTTSDMSNCFIDTFKSWMEARECEDPVRLGVDRSPCCQSFDFPYSQYVFDKCIGEANSMLRKTPQYHPNLNGGIRFFRNTSRIAAVIVEFQSIQNYTDSFTQMDRFYQSIDEWVSWQINNTAPLGLKSGWFFSNNLGLLALQLELEQSTYTSIVLEIFFAMLAVLISTRDAILTVAGTLAISSVIITTMAILIQLKWTLGVAESVLISLTIGLSIDFALHYCVAYKEALRRSDRGLLLSVLGKVGSPVALATVTTSLAGFVIFWSDILAYQELGTFLMVIAVMSWLTSTFFLLPMLATLDLIAHYGEHYARRTVQRALKLLIDRL